MTNMLRRLLMLSLVVSACGDDDGKKRANAGDASLLPDGGPSQDGGLDLDAASMDGGDAGDGGTVRTDATVVPGDASIPFEINDAGQVLCANDTPCACSNGIDEDNDRLVDMDDPECVSAWDDDEASFATGISGDNRDFACQDCFFDGNSGAGDDGCRLPSSCLTTGLPTSGQGSCSSCEQTAPCKAFCQAYTPNGCDCFGCCTVRVGGGTQSFLLSDGCSIDGTTVSAGCMACVPSTSCGNTCGRCELCPGKTLSDLPADCGATSPDGGVGGDAGAPTPSCDDGQARCGEGLPACGGFEACTFGCCTRIPVL